MTLHELLHQTATSALPLMDPSTGNMPPGHNGPYRHPETPVRNTGHWMMTFLKVHGITGERRFLDAAEKALGYILSPAARPKGPVFWHRNTPGKDGCNGLIGPAWTIEALLAAAASFDRPELVRLSEDLFLLHPFDERRGVWYPVEVDGSPLPLDDTFNHQLWFAASGGMIAATTGGEVDSRVRRFLDGLPRTLGLLPGGLIWHPLAVDDPVLRPRAKEFVERYRSFLRPRSDRYQKAVGYHAFNLYAFALLQNRYGDHPFWISRRFRALWRHANSAGFRRALEGNTYGYPYNPPGIEMAFALEAFGDDTRRAKQEWWMGEQVRRTYDPGARMMSRGASDPVTCAARMYEATRLPDMNLPPVSH